MGHHRNLINGEWLDGVDVSVNRNPSRPAEVIGEYARADAAQVDAAIAAAHAALPGWAAKVPAERGAILERVGVALADQADRLGAVLAREEGKTLAEARGEVLRAAQIFKFFAAETQRLTGELLSSVRPGISVEVTREPVGVVGIITPWNFPIAIPAWKIAPALAYGNTVVFKPADLVPGSAWELVNLLAEAGLPAGVVNLVMGRGRVVGDAMVADPRVAAISFTGSTGTGRGIAAKAAARLARVQLEMGGKNPLVVLDDADLDVAVEAAIQGSFYSTGQRCTASSRLIVTRGIHDRFVAAMTRRVDALVVGDALDAATQIGPVVDQGQLDQDLAYIGLGQAEGAVLAAGGRVQDTAAGGYFLTPALFVGASNSMRLSREEIFGPVAAVIAVADYDEALAVANDTDFGLAAGICTTSLKHAQHFKRNAQAGMVMVNLSTAGVDFHVPFGGRKGSSFGPREQGRYAAEFYTTVKTSYTCP